MFCFFFQAEVGIRYGHVTGVQTCALPIYDDVDEAVRLAEDTDYGLAAYVEAGTLEEAREIGLRLSAGQVLLNGRSEERRGGKEWRARGGAGGQRKREAARGTARWRTAEEG